MEFFNTEREMLEIILEATKGVAVEEFKAKVFEDEELVSKKTKGHRRPTNKGERRKAEVEHRFKRAKFQLRGLEASIDKGARGVSYLPWGSIDGRTTTTGAELAKIAKWAENYYDPTSDLRKKEADEAKLNEVIDFVDVEHRRGLGVSPSLVEARYWATYARLEKSKAAFDNAYKRWKNAWKALQDTKTEEVTMTLEEAVNKYESIVLEKQEADNELYNASLEREEALLSYQVAFDDYEKVVREK